MNAEWAEMLLLGVPAESNPRVPLNKHSLVLMFLLPPISSGQVVLHKFGIQGVSGLIHVRARVDPGNFCHA
jgi:hypothetical protein